MKKMMLALMLVMAMMFGAMALAETVPAEPPTLEEAPAEEAPAEEPADDSGEALREAMDALRGARQTRREAEYEEELQGYVDEGLLTQDQADLLLNQFKARAEQRANGKTRNGCMNGNCQRQNRGQNGMGKAPSQNGMNGNGMCPGMNGGNMAPGQNGMGGMNPGMNPGQNGNGMGRGSHPGMGGMNGGMGRGRMMSQPATETPEAPANNEGI